MRRILVIVTLLMFSIQPGFAEEASQTDWSGGDGEPGPVNSLQEDFASARQISWRSVPGQLALSSTPLASARKHIVGEHLGDAYGLFVVDFDNDGDPDVLATTNESAEVIIWFNEGGDPVRWTEHVVDGDYPGGTSIHPVDMDGDGDLDIVGAAQTPGDNLSWWRNDGGHPLRWTRFTIDDQVPVACNVYAGDIDGDGDVDVSSTSWSRRFVAWWRNDGGDPVTWTKEVIDSIALGAHSAVGSDVDGDGDTDMVATAALADSVRLYLNEGGEPAVWTTILIGDDLDGVRHAMTGDIDHDGRTDIVAAAFDGSLRWWRNEGGEPVSFTEHVIADDCTGGHYVAIADMDGNGTDDVLVVPWDMHSIYWYGNSGDESIVWTAHQVEPGFLAPLTALPADIDGDGDLDVVGTSSTLGQVAWWEITDFTRDGELDGPVLDLRQPGVVAAIDYSAAVPEGAEVQLMYRTSDDPGDLGPWSSPIDQPSRAIGPFDRYLQYRVEMTSADGSNSSIVHEIAITYGWPWNLEKLERRSLANRLD